LPNKHTACYGFRLNLAQQCHCRSLLFVSNIIGEICHYFSRVLKKIIISALLAAAATTAFAQGERPAGVAPPGPGEVVIWAVSKSADGPLYRLIGNASLLSTELQLWADELIYNEETGEAQARGNVHFKHFQRGEELWADRAEYNLKEESGKFENVRGASPARAEYRPGLLVTTNPTYFEGRWAERLKNRYILYDGMVTNCRLPKPWWTLRAPRFDIVPGERAVGYRAIFRLRALPLLYAPVLYKSLEERPRKSGFLTPNIGNSSRRGRMVGAAYYWAFHRSYDATYRAQWFTARGLAHTVDLRGKPTQASDFNLYLYGVNDRGKKLPGGERRKEGGFILSADARAELGSGFFGRVDGNYLTSMRFRRAFTESFNEAIDSEVHSVGYVQKFWPSFNLNIVAARLENIQSAGSYVPDLKGYLPDEKIVIRKLPQVEFSARERRLGQLRLPVWVSLQSSASLLRREQPTYQSRQFMPRTNLQPRIMTALRWKGFNLLPSFSIQQTYYGTSLEQGRPVNRAINRFAREFTLELAPPALARVFASPSWLGEKVKHVIEPRAVFRYAAGYEDFSRLIRFDATELAANTTELELSIINRFYVKRGNEVHELLSWELWQSRYFDPDFGGSVTAFDPLTGKARRNVNASTLRLTAFTYLDTPRHYSPVVSALRITPLAWLGLEWRSDYDPLRGRPVNSWLTADWRRSIYSISIGHNLVRSGQQLSASANQFNGRFTLGGENRRGWNAAFDVIYDFRSDVMRYAITQVTYNTDCCGFSLQYRRMGLPDRSENQFRLAFTVANIGSFGTLRRQDRLF